MEFYVHKLVVSDGYTPEKKPSKKVLARLLDNELTYDRYSVVTKFLSRVKAKYALRTK